jgi:heterodisulfide reductase subunit D
MAPQEQSLANYFDSETAKILGACTACGKCVEVCPVVPYAGLKDADPKTVAHGVVDFLAHRAPLAGASASFAYTCNGCGECIPACPEGVNPRKMLVLANTMHAGERTQTPQLFRKMSRAIRLMAGMQLLPAEFARVRNPPRRTQAPIVFYLGCNALRTPHLLFNAMYVLDALGTDYEVVGGPGSCCGIVQSKWEGELGRGERMINATLTRFEGLSPEKVLSWCPSCNLHIGETLAGFHSTSFEFGHFTTYLADHLDELRLKFVRPLPLKAVLHAHVGLADLGRNVARVLAAIPGLQLVDTVAESGYTCGGSGCARAPELMKKEHAQLIDRVRETGAGVLVTFYHNCHAAFVRAENEGGLRVLNYTDLLVEALGAAPHEDVFKRLRLIDDWKMIVDEAEPYLRANGIEFDRPLLEKILPDVFRMAEFTGGLDCFASRT